VTVQCMKNIGFSEVEISSVLDTVVSIILLGNINFHVISKPGLDETFVASESKALLT